MGSNRRKFISNTFLGGLGAAALPIATSQTHTNHSHYDVFDPISSSMKTKYAKLDQILKQPVFKREFFSQPVMIKTVELLLYISLIVLCLPGHQG